MLAEVKKVVASGGGPAYQNLRVLLAKMDALPVGDPLCPLPRSLTLTFI
jgi:hypothetical protein